MPALGLHYCVHVLSGNKAGAKRNGQRCHVPAGTKILLRQNGIHYDLRLCPGNTDPLRVNEHRNSALCPYGVRLFQCFDTDSAQPFNCGFTFIDRLAQGYLTADGCGLYCFQYQHTQPGAP